MRKMQRNEPPRGPIGPSSLLAQVLSTQMALGLSGLTGWVPLAQATIIFRVDHLLISPHSSKICTTRLGRHPAHPGRKGTLIGGKIRLEVNVRQRGVFSARIQLPQGPWISELLGCIISLTEGRYFTIVPVEGYCGVELEGADSRLVKVVGQCLRAPADRLRALFNTAFLTAFNHGMRHIS